MFPNYAPWCGLKAYRRGVTDKLVLVKIICIEGQGCTFTFGLIFLGPAFCERYFCLIFFMLARCQNKINLIQMY